MTREELRARLFNLVETHCIERWVNEKQLTEERYELWLEENKSKKDQFIEKVTLSADQMLAKREPTAFDYEIV